MDIREIDKNFKLNAVTATDVTWRHAACEPFKTYGVYYEPSEGRYRRMSKETAERVSDGVAQLSIHTAGGRVRFTTDSPYIAIRCLAPYGTLMSHITMAGQFGFSVTSDGEYVGRISPEFDSLLPSSVKADRIAFEGMVSLPDALNNVTLFMPLYNGVCELYIGVKQGSTLLSPPDYRHEQPVLFYGSSITQGGCASRPGNDYIGLLSQWLDTDIINLGFSGNAKGEKEMTDYLCSLSPSVFVLDYDHNAPDTAHLERTHLPIYEAFRAAHPDTPVIMLSLPDYRTRPDAVARRAVISRTLEHAVSLGDDNVYFIGGEQLFGKDYPFCTVDGCHPNDLGFYRMAEAVYNVLAPLIKK